jgi:hypothetical protein
VIQQPAGAKSAISPAAVAYRLEQLLPPGQVDHVHWSADIRGQIRLYLDQGQGPGMLSVTVAGNSPPLECRTAADAPTTCFAGPGGAHVQISHLIGNCVQSTLVGVDHGHGVIVQVTLSSCLASTGGTNPAGHEPLNLQQAIAIAADPSWGVRMSTALVDAGGLKYPNLR